EQTAQARQKVAEIQVRLAENQGEISSLKQQLQRYVEKESEEREHVERLRLQGQEPTRESMLLSELGEAKGRQQQLEAELEKARKRCYEFQALSQQNESALAQLNETYDAYKLEKENAIAEMRRSLEVAEKRRDELQVRAEELEADLKAQKEELAQLSQARANKEAELQRRISSLEEFKKMYEGNLNQLRQDLTRQTELTREAQENYERELVSHAKDVQVTLASREGWSATKKELAHVTTELEAARKEVESERARFSELQSTHESRIAEHEERIASLRKQNEILMSYLAAVGHDTGSIDFDNPEPPKTDATTAATTGDSRSAGQLGEVIVQLRRERELLSAQLELTQQETRRWHQQATHIQRALDQAREELKGSASKSQAEDVDSGRDELQASILRESNITLRVELQQARDRLKVVEARLHEFEDKIVPELRGSKAELEAELSARKADIEQLERMNQRWKERHEQILAKYDRVDPEELHELQAKLAEHQDKYAALNSELAACRKEMSTLTKTKAMLEARIKHASNVIEAKTESIKNLEARQESAKTSYEGQIKQLRERVAELQSKLGQAQQQQQQQQQQSVQQNTSAAQEGEIQSLKSRIEDYNQQLNHARETLARNSTTLHSVRQELHTSRSEVGTLKSRLQGLEEDNKNLTENYNLAQRLAINYLSDIKALKLQIDACKDQAQATNRAQSLPPASAQQHTSATEQSIPSSHPVLSTQKPAIFSSAEPPAQSDAPTSTAADDDKDTKSTQQTVVSSAAGEGSVDSSTPAPSAFSKVDSTVATTATATVVIPASHPTLTPAPATSTASTGKPMTPNDLKMKLRMMKQSLKREQDSSPVKTGTVQSQIQSQATPPPAGTPDFPRTTTQTGLAVAAPDAAQVSPTPITLKRPSEEEHGVDKRPHVLGSSSNADAQSSTNADEAQPPTTKDDDTSVPTIQKASDADVASPAQNVVSENNVDK
ncbi:Filament-forming protein, partial [Spiromyces aspiralis]